MPDDRAQDLFGDYQSIRGEVLGVVYRDVTSGFGVLELLDDDGNGGVRCRGPLADLSEGQRVTVVGRDVDHPRHGMAFEVLYWELATPSTVNEIAALVDGEFFGDVEQAWLERCVAQFGAGLAEALQGDPSRLVSEAQLQPEQAAALHAAWMASRAFADLVRLVAPLGWRPETARTAYREFGREVAEIARNDPYRLIVCDAIDFAQLDRLGRARGCAAHDPERLAAGACAAVRTTTASHGHQYLPRALARDAIVRLLGVDLALAEVAVDAAVERGWLGADRIADDEVVAPVSALDDEACLAREVARVVQTARPLAPPASVARDQGSSALTEQQLAAVDAAMLHGVSILTGGPGTGKTHTVEAIVQEASRHNLAVALVAPTGRAAKRMEELSTGHAVTATTIHRLLEARPDESGGFVFRYGADLQLPHEVIVVDELSMCDTALARHLFSAVGDGTHVVVVGDPDQLPAVGVGDVLRSLIDSHTVAVTHLTELHRQARDSRIVQVAIAVRDRQAVRLDATNGDVFVAAERAAERLRARVVAAAADRAPAYFGVDPDDVQVLAPSYRGPVGVHALNAALKAARNPPAGRPDVGGFHVGDRVMQTRNDPELDVANGDVGSVIDLDAQKATVRIRFPRREVTFDRRQLRFVVPAWAITVHKSQGGQWPVVVLVVHSSHRGMLHPTLLYTAVTRASQALIIAGDLDQLQPQVESRQPAPRITGLTWRLRQLLNHGDKQSAQRTGTVGSMV